MISIRREKWHPFFEQKGIRWVCKDREVFVEYSRPFVSFPRGMFIFVPTLQELVAATNAFGGKRFVMNGEQRRVYKELKSVYNETQQQSAHSAQSRGRGPVHGSQ